MNFKNYLESNAQIRAGIIPYYLDQGVVWVCLMIPSNANFGGLKPQIAKGRVEEGEDVQETAIREGEEELGLKRTNFAGPVVMVGQSMITGQEESYSFYCYAVQVKNIKNFNKPHYETGWSGFIPIEEALAKIKNTQKSLLLSTINKIKQLHPQGT